MCNSRPPGKSTSLRASMASSIVMVLLRMRSLRQGIKKLVLHKATMVIETACMLDHTLLLKEWNWLCAAGCRAAAIDTIPDSQGSLECILICLLSSIIVAPALVAPALCMQKLG
jgi:hypothetical protein